MRKSQFVRLVDPKSGSLAGPFNAKEILSKLDRTKFWIQQVVPGDPDRATVEYDPTAPPASVDIAELAQFPICKLIDKKEEFDKQRALKRKASSSESAPSSAAGTSKEVQLTFTVSPNDLEHKLRQAKKEMIRGARINLVVANKSGGRRYKLGVDPKEDQRRQELLQQIENVLCSAEDGDQQPIARRLQDVTWQRGGSAVMSFECFKR